MKVYLTEAQLQLILINEKLKQFDENCLLCEWSNFNKWNNLPKHIKNDIKVALAAGVPALTIAAAVNNMTNVPTEIKQKYVNWINNKRDMLNNNTFDYSQEMQELHDLKVRELNRCMQDKMKFFRGPKNYDPNEIKLSADEIITQCENYGYDPVLAAAQTWNETKCGTSDRAKRSNSAFSVGSYDNGKDAVNYKHVNASIEPYIKLMQNDYGINSDQLQKIFNGSAKLVNGVGARYASDPNYENTLRQTYNSIKKAYPVLSWTLEDYINSKSTN